MNGIFEEERTENIVLYELSFVYTLGWEIRSEDGSERWLLTILNIYDIEKILCGQKPVRQAEPSLHKVSKGELYSFSLWMVYEVTDRQKEQLLTADKAKMRKIVEDYNNASKTRRRKLRKLYSWLR